MFNAISNNFGVKCKSNFRILIWTPPSIIINPLSKIICPSNHYILYPFLSIWSLLAQEINLVTFWEIEKICTPLFIRGNIQIERKKIKTKKVMEQLGQLNKFLSSPKTYKN